MAPPKTNPAAKGHGLPTIKESSKESHYPPKPCPCTKCKPAGCGSGAEALAGICKYCQLNCK